MAGLISVIYDPPAPNFPYIAVFFDTDGEVLSARAVPSPEAGEAFIAEIMAQFNVLPK